MVLTCASTAGSLTRSKCTKAPIAPGFMELPIKNVASKKQAKASVCPPVSTTPLLTPPVLPPAALLWVPLLAPPVLPPAGSPLGPSADSPFVAGSPLGSPAGTPFVAGSPLGFPAGAPFVAGSLLGSPAMSPPGSFLLSLAGSLFRPVSPWASALPASFLAVPSPQGLFCPWVSRPQWARFPLRLSCLWVVGCPSSHPGFWRILGRG
ncbi:hypothetical protein DSO57_1005512 [Entomophthora muscae]|uniref:Uncharacterized protein n=1 Tax=Entomophthora muscae TaxID=34485 RepID=A0ACC2SXC6_9FUNG|nr:hypothetical protein DSO57_1005512 [Entomophthora muscae]